MARGGRASDFGIGPLFHPDKLELSTPLIFSSFLKESMQNENDFFLSCVEFLDIFKNDKLDLMIIEGDIAGLVTRKEVFDSEKEAGKYLLQTLDFVPITLQNPGLKYSIEDCNEKLRWQLGGVGGTERNLDLDLTITKRLKSSAENVLKFLLPPFPILEVRRKNNEAIFCAVHRISEKNIQIIGVFGVEGIRGKFNQTGPERVDEFSERYSLSTERVKLLFNQSQKIICSSTAFFATSIHNVCKSLSNYTIKVGASVLDRVSGYDPHIPLELISKEFALNKPITFQFSSLAANMFQNVIPESTTYNVFRDAQNFFFTEKIPGRWAKILKIPVETVISSEGRITSGKISSAIKKSLSLTRDEENISINRAFNHHNEMYESFSSQVAESLAFWMKNIQITSLSEKIDRTKEVSGTDWKLKMIQDEESSQRLAEIIPVVIRLSLGLFDPFLSSSERRKIPSTNSKRKKQTRHTQESRTLLWGVDTIRYLTSTRNNTSRGSYWVRPHSHSYHLSDKRTIEQYEQSVKNKEPGFALIRRGNKYIGVRTVGDYWCNSDGKQSSWDGVYNFGKVKSKGNYSQMAVDWIKSIEKAENIIIQHAEQGGEFRLRLGYDDNIKREKYIWLDGYCEQTNTVYEFHGDVWHGNPNVYSAEVECHPHIKGEEGTAGYLYMRTLERESAIKDLGFNLVTIWENDWINDNFTNQ